MSYLRCRALLFGCCLPFATLACDGADRPSGFADGAVFDAPARGETRRPTADGGRRARDQGVRPEADAVDLGAPDVGDPARMSSRPDAGSAPDAGASAGTGCQALATDYQVALQLAKACNPILPTPSCQKLVGDALDCPCDTTVDAANTAAVATLQQLESQWLQGGCGQGVDCGAVTCTTPSKGNCQSAGLGNQGACLD